jgi:hypothetical protein
MRALAMAKHRRVWNASVYEKYVREGRGCGWGSGYSPWIRVQDFASRGVISRVKSRTTGRVHHLMSNNELAYFYVLDWSEKVTDIREQYPLSDIESAVIIASQAGIKYPVDNISGYPYVLTCDFMITTSDGAKARTIKMASELSNARTLEKLEIERRYWSAQGIDWKIITEREIPYQKSKNIEWLYMAHGIDAEAVDPYKLLQAKEMMMQLFSNNDCSILGAVQTVEVEYFLNADIGLQIFKQLVLDRMIVMNLNEPLNLNARGVAVSA